MYAMAILIELPPDLAAKLKARVDSGESTDVIETLREALDALEAQDAAKLATVRAKVARSLNDPRPSIPADEVFDRVEAAVKALRA